MNNLINKLKFIIKSSRFYLVVFCFVLIILLIFSFNKIGNLIYVYFQSTNNVIHDEIKVDRSLNYIVDSSELDSDVVNKVFANGMNIDSFKSVCNYSGEIIMKNNDYKYISYDFDRKLHYSDVEEILYSVNDSDAVKLEIIGKSVDNRNIYGVEIGFGDKVIFLDANIHAAEVASVTFLTKFLNDLVYKYENGNVDIINALNHFKIVLIPSLNPDGYEVYNFGIESIRNKDLWIYQNKDIVNFRTFKFNANGVDLNRNFPTQNAGLYYKGYNLISSVSLEKTVKNYTYFGGSEMGSEPETQAAIYYILKHYKNTIAYINMHSQGRVIYAGKPNLSKEFNDITIDFADKVSDITGYRVHGLSSEEVGEGNDGTITDFFSEMVHEFKFSSETLRLSTDKYKGNVNFVHDTAVITLETLNDYTDNVNVFKNEYYVFGVENLLYSIINL